MAESKSIMGCIGTNGKVDMLRIRQRCNKTIKNIIAPCVPYAQKYVNTDFIMIFGDSLIPLITSATRDDFISSFSNHYIIRALLFMCNARVTQYAYRPEKPLVRDRKYNKKINNVDINIYDYIGHYKKPISKYDFISDQSYLTPFRFQRIVYTQREGLKAMKGCTLKDIFDDIRHKRLVIYDEDVTNTNFIKDVVYYVNEGWTLELDINNQALIKLIENSYKTSISIIRYNRLFPYEFNEVFERISHRENLSSECKNQIDKDNCLEMCRQYYSLNKLIKQILKAIIASVSTNCDGVIDLIVDYSIHYCFEYKETSDKSFDRILYGKQQTIRFLFFRNYQFIYAIIIFIMVIGHFHCLN